MASFARGFRTIAACAGAYALVLQIVLTSALAASLPIDQSVAGLWRLCSSAKSGDADDGKHLPTAHSPHCCCRADAVALPVPPATPLIDRFAIERHFNTALRAAFLSSAPRASFQPRGPPSAA